jgi:SAM-dependent methyltransferase
VPTHSAVAGFDLAAEAYERGRPEYPPEAVAYLVRELGIGPGCRVVELGAGTGKFTRAIVATGAGVVALEPTRAMRLVLHRQLPGVPVLAGVAERIPLRAGAAEVVVAAQAFHWFASRPTVDEMVRVLSPSGRIGLVWNVRDESLSWTAKLGALINSHETGTPAYKRVQWKSVFQHRSDLTELTHREFRFTQPLDREALLDRVLSVSFIALLPEAERLAIARGVGELLDSEPATRGRHILELPYRTDVYTCHRLPGGPVDATAP